MKMIKHLFLMIAISFVFLIVEGCKEDDPTPEEHPTPEEQLIGSWEHISTVTSGCTDPTDNENYSCSNDCTVLEFTSTSVKVTGSTGITYPYTINGSTLKVTVEDEVETYTISFSGKNLMLSEQDAPDDGNCIYVSTYIKI